MNTYLSESDIHHVHETLISRFYDKQLKKKKAKMRKNINRYLSKEDRKTIKMIDRYSKESRYFDKEWITLKRTTLKNYIKKEFNKNGDFGLLHNRVDSFREGVYIY